jgi:hypothetical protein
MVASDPIRGTVTEPTKINRNKDGSVEFPNDPHINQQGDATGPRPQTQLSGYAQGGTSNPPVGDDGSPKWFSPEGKEEKSPQPMFERDAEVNPRGDGHGASTRFEGEFGTQEEPVYVPAKGDSKPKGN